MTPSSSAQLQLFSRYPLERGGHPLLQIPLMQKLIRSGMPELLDGSKASSTVLDQIEHYLFLQNALHLPALERKIGQPLYDTLYGLKILLRGSNINVVSWALEEQKRRFGAWLRQEWDPSASEEE